MHRGKIVDIGLICILLIFAIWFFGKSFGYDTQTGNLWIARNQVADFGLHLSLIRSFSIGDNFPPESPFFPGERLTYHFLFDVIVGFITGIGVRIDVALNGLSVLALTGLLYGMYRMSQSIFGNRKRIGILSALLFLSPGGWGFVDFFTSVHPSEWLQRWWRLPDFLHSGPFDGSIYSTFFSLNVYLNQRHLVAGLSIGMLCIWFALITLSRNKRLSWKEFCIGGLLLGALFWMHSLVWVATALTVGFLGVYYRRWKEIMIVGFLAGIVALPRALVIFQTAQVHPWLTPGFLATKPLSMQSWISYWWHNAGLLVILIPLGVFLAKPRQRLLWWSIFPLFVAANILQFSYRIEHNHSFFNYFFLFANMYAAFALDRIWQRGSIGVIAFFVLILTLGMNGILQFPAVKNDFRFVVSDISQNPLMSWITTNTAKKSIFLAPATLIDPVTLSGRYTYVGPFYYLQVMGYDPSLRLERMKQYLEHPSDEVIQIMRAEGISYILVPVKKIDDYPYVVDTAFYDQYTKTAYTDPNVTVYQL